MKSMLKSFLFIAVFAVSSHALAEGFVGSAWTGDSELSLDGKLLCSVDSSKSPVYKPVIGGSLPGLTIREGGEGWIWLSASGGCADGWFNGTIGMRMDGSSLRDARGTLIGTHSASGFEAKDFADASGKMQLLSVKFDMESKQSAKIRAVFKRAEKPGRFEFTAVFTRHHDSNWP